MSGTAVLKIQVTLRRPEVQAVVQKWRGAKYEIEHLSWNPYDKTFAVVGQFTFADGATEQCGIPSVDELARRLGRKNSATVRAALELEIGGLLTRFRKQASRAQADPQRRADAERRHRESERDECWEAVDANLRLILQLSAGYEAPGVIDRVTELASRLICKDVLES